MNSWTGLFAVTAFPHFVGPLPLLRTQPPHPTLTDPKTRPMKLICEEPIPKLRIIGVGVDERVHEMGVLPVTITAPLSPPLIKRLRRETEHPASQPHRKPLRGQVTGQRVHHPRTIK
jgi:hypothetical protein